MKNAYILLLTASLLGLAVGPALAAEPHATAPYTGHELAGQAKVSIAQAEAIALKARPGKVTDRELEQEGGGLRYSFDVKSGGATWEVGVDAKTGKVLENVREGANPD